VTDRNVKHVEEAAVSSSTLLSRVQAQDPAAWERLVSLCSPLVYQWCRQSGLQPADAADVGQEVFAAVFRKVGEFRRNRPGDGFRRWLRTIACGKVIDFFRARRPAETAAGGSDALRLLLQQPADADSSGAEEEGVLYRRALDVLHRDFAVPTWQAFWRVTVESQNPADVARDLGMTVNAVYLAKSHVLRRMRAEFADLLEIEPG
jgi:RNA polymerase sigma-70 factor (ECF subfamily)